MHWSPAPAKPKACASVSRGREQQIDLRSKQPQDFSDDLQPSQKVLGMLKIISEPCGCLDPTEGHGYQFHHHHNSHLLGNLSLRHPNPVVGFNLPEGLCFQQRRCVVLIHRPTGGGSNGWPANKDKHNNAREHASR